MAPMYNWSGFYGGLNAGGASSRNCWALTNDGTNAVTPFDLGCHNATGALVAKSAAKGVDLDKLSLAEMRAIEPRIAKAVYKVLTVEASVAARKSYGGTAPANVARAVKDARKRFL